MRYGSSPPLSFCQWPDGAWCFFQSGAGQRADTRGHDFCRGGTSPVAQSSRVRPVPLISAQRQPVLCRWLYRFRHLILMLFGLLPLTYASPPRQSRPDMLPLSQFHSSARRKSRIFRCLIPFLLMSNSSRDTTYLGKLSWMPSYAPNSRFTVSSEASRYVTCT